MRTKALKFNIILSIICELFSLISGLILPRLMISFFGSSVNGLVSSVAQFLGFSTVLRSGLGAASRAMLFKPLAENDMKAVSNIMVATQSHLRKVALIIAGYVVAVATIYPFIAQTNFSWDYIFTLVLVMGTTVFADNFFGIKAVILLQADQKYYVTHICTLITNILSFVVTILLINLNFSIVVVKIGTALTYFLKPIILNLYIRKKYDIDWRSSGGVTLLNQRWDAFAQQLAVIINSNIDLVLLTLFVTLEDVSVYTVYFMIVSNIKRLIETLFSGINSTFGDMIAKQEDENLKKNFLFVEWATCVVSVIMFSVTAIMMIPFIRIYMDGADYNYIVPSIAIIMPLAGLLECLKSPYGTLIEGAGCFKDTRNISIVEIFINIVISVGLLIVWGMPGVIIGTIVAAIIKALGLAFYSFEKILKMNKLHIFKNYVLYVLSFVLIVSLSFLVKIPSDLNYFDWALWSIGFVCFACIVVSVISLINNKKQFRYLKEKLFLKRKMK